MNIEYCLFHNNHETLFNKLKQLDPTKKFKVEVKPWKSKRSLDQNARYWKLITGFGAHLGYSRDEMHDICRFKFLRNAIEIEGERLPLLQSTPKLTVAEFTEYMENVERWGVSLGYIFEE